MRRTDRPILSSSKNWSKLFGKSLNHVVPESLVVEESRWLLYYGAADKVCCVALWNLNESNFEVSIPGSRV